MSMSPRPLIAGNWKMNGLRQDAMERVAAIAALAGNGDPGCDLVICPPTTLLHQVAGAVDGGPLELGAQDCHSRESGAHTGDVSAAMLADAGCRYVIVGHSERRADHQEVDALVRTKAEAAHGAGLTAIICLGESEAQRDSGDALAVVESQLAGSLPDGTGAGDTVIAYEPIWAIGTGRTPTNEQIAEVHDHLRARLGARGDGMRLLYGGSVKPANAGGILALANVDGALIGGASLVADDFWAICRSMH
ncbi:MAG: triose-phosphate isomerase [Alphaproteobacteria bacterium]